MSIRERVMAARSIQRERFNPYRRLHSNAGMGSKQLQKFCPLGSEAQGLLKMAITELHFSARAYDKVLRLARTLADLDNTDDIAEHHVAEAIQYRSLDRQLF